MRDSASAGPIEGCPSCGAPVPDGARFCVDCGTRLADSGCAGCGAPLLAGRRFCPACGRDVAPDAVAEAAPTPAAGLVPDSVGRAERRRVSVLFVDLVDFTSLAESMDPEEVRAVQARYFEVARLIVATHGGTLEKFIGDAVMAVWGAPAAHEDDAERAVRAALAIVHAVDRIGGAAAGRALRAHGAVATGEAAVTVGAVDQGLVAGDLVNIAARLQGRAPAGAVVADRATREATAATVAFARIGSLSLKGRTARLEAFRATGLRQVETVHGASHAGRLVGRERVMREITDLMQGVIEEGRGRLVSVTGIAGIGKSRLAWELDRWVDAHPDDIAWHEGRALAYGEGVAFSAVAQMVRRRARIDEAAPPELARRQLASALTELIRDEAERRWIEPRLAALLSQDVADGYDRDELFAAWRRFFERVSELTPVVMIFEDLQWADPGLLDFVEYMATWSRTRRIFLLVLSRPELLDARPTWGSGVGSFTAITLDRLPDGAMRELLADRATDLEPRLVDPILHSAGGVPLYAVEVARMLMDRAAAPRRRTARAATPAQGEVPDSLHGVIAARLDAIPEEERRLLMAASVLGNRFRPGVLRAMVGGDGSVLRDRLDGLVRREMLTLDDDLGSPGRGQFGFVQDLVREVAYQTLARTERRALHLEAARHFESAEVDAPEALAAHLVAAHRLAPQPRDAARIGHRAVGALRRAARGAMAIHVPSRALELLENALGLADDTVRPTVLADAADAARAAGHLDRAAALLRDLALVQAEAGDASGAARTRARLASVLLAAQANEPALEELETAISGIRRWQRDPAGIELVAQLARARSVLGDDADALRWADRALPAARRLDLRGVATELRITRATAQLALGESEPALADLRAAIREAQDGEMLRTELRARNNLAWGLLGDDPIAAGETARQGLGLAIEMGIGDFLVPLADLACTAALEAGTWDWALATIEQLSDQGTDGSYRLVLSAVSGVIHALRGEPSARRNLELLEPLPAETDTQIVAVVRLARAWAAFLDQDLGAARGLADQAIANAPNLPLHELALAVRIRLWQGDRGAAAAALADLTLPGGWGRAADAARRSMEAGIAALAADPDAERHYREAREAWGQLEVPLQLALVLLDQQRLLPGTVDQAELDRVIASLDAGGLHALAATDGVRSPAAAARPARSRRPSADTAPRTGGDRRSRPGRARRSPAR
jgi:class 3 adenylate cyclase/tetratricopeptide (TPR) repeat protein